MTEQPKNVPEEIDTGVKEGKLSTVSVEQLKKEQKQAVGEAEAQKAARGAVEKLEAFAKATGEKPENIEMLQTKGAEVIEDHYNRKVEQAKKEAAEGGVLDKIGTWKKIRFDMPERKKMMEKGIGWLTGEKYLDWDKYIMGFKGKMAHYESLLQKLDTLKEEHDTVYRTVEATPDVRGKVKELEGQIDETKDQVAEFLRIVGNEPQRMKYEFNKEKGEYESLGKLEN